MRTPSRSLGVVGVVAAVTAAACSSYPSSFRSAEAEVTGTITYGVDGEAVAELLVDVAISSTAGPNVALDSVRFVDGATTWTLDPLQVDASDWPVTFDAGFAETHRRFRVVARTRPQSTGTAGPLMFVGLLNHEGSFEVLADMEQVSRTVDECVAPTLEDAAASVDVDIAWSTSTLDGLVYQIEDIEGDADGLWMAGVTFGESVRAIRLHRATSAGLGGIKETEAQNADIAVGATKTAVVATQDETELVTVRRFDDGLTQLWKHTATADSTSAPLVAVSGGRVALAYAPLLGAALVDGEVVGAATGVAALATFDEASGDLLGWSELPLLPTLLEGAGGGAFASATKASKPPTLRVVEADLTERWSVELASTPLDLTVTPDGDIWIETAVGVTRYAQDGVEKASYPLPFQGYFAPLPDGSILFANESGLGRVTATGDVTVGELPAASAPWCDVPKHFAIAATGDGAAIAYVPAFDADPVPAYVGKLSP